MLSLTSYLGSGEYRDRYLGVRIPTTNISAEQVEEITEVRCEARGSVVRKAIADTRKGAGGAVMSHERVPTGLGCDAAFI